MKTNLKKPFNLYITALELNSLKREAKEFSVILNKKLTVSRLIRLKLKLNRDLKIKEDDK